MNFIMTRGKIIFMDNISIVFSKQFTNRVEQILHSPCNIPGKMFEMTMVVDSNLHKKEILNTIPKLLLILKRHSEVFRNVRLNIVNWYDDNNIINQVVPMSMAMLESRYNDYKQNISIKSYDRLMNNLKLFHARSKLIIIVTDGSYQASPKEELLKIMQPFLNRKVMNVVVSADDIKIE